MNRAECLDYLHAYFCGNAYMSREAFDAFIADWEVRPMMACGDSIGVIMTQGAEIHVALSKRGALTHARRIIRECLTDGIKEYGYLTTRATIGDASVHRFLLRLGFISTITDEHMQHYRIDAVKIH